MSIVRDVWLAVRMRDYASRVLGSLTGNIGKVYKDMDAAEKDAAIRRRTALDKTIALSAAVSGVGLGMIGLGISGFNAFKDMYNAGEEYKKSIQLAFTQIEQGATDADGALIKVHESVGDIAESIASIGREIPVALSDLSTGMYDIYSTIEDIDKEAADTLLRGIATAAVAGNTTVETAGAGIMQVMNAWGRGAEDVTKISDVMFAAVRDGTMTYDEFIRAMGKSIPSVKKGGGTFEELAAQMAFLTARGQTAEQASTAIGRAYDLISNPRTQSNMQKLGMSMYDATGAMKPMGTILDEIADKMEGMTEEDRNAALRDMFKGGGMNVQAMRFMSQALTDTGGYLDKFTGKMETTSGATADAYEIMAANSTTQKTIFGNNVTEMSRKVQEVFEPTVIRFMENINGLFDAFNRLPKETQQTIIKIAGIAAVLSIVIGVFMVLAGIIIVVGGIISAVGFAAFAPWLIAGAIITGLIGLLLYLLASGAPILEWLQQIADWGRQAWEALVSGVETAIGAVLSFADRVFGPYIDAYNNLVEKVIGTGQELWKTISNLWQDVVNFFTSIFDFIMGFVDGFMNVVQSVNFGPFISAFENVYGKITGFMADILSFVIPLIGVLVQFILNLGQLLVKSVTQIIKFLTPVIGLVGAIFGTAFNIIVTIFQALFNVISGIIDFLVALFTGDFAGAFQAVADIIGSIFMGIFGIFAHFFNGIITGVSKFVTDIIAWFTNLWDELVGHSIIPDMVNAIIEWFGTLISTVTGAISGFIMGIINFFINMATGIAQTIGSAVAQAIAFFINMGSSILGAVSSFVGGVIGKIAAFAASFISYISNAITSAVTFFSGLPGRVISAVISLASMLGSQAAIWMTNMKNAISRGIDNALTFFRNFPGRVIGALGNMGSKLYSSGKALLDGFISGIKNGISRAIGAVSSGIQRIRDFFPFSPAKTGPFSGRGYLTYSGSAMMQDYAKAILKNGKHVYSAVDTVMSNVYDSASPSFSLGGYTPVSPVTSSGGNVTNSNNKVILQIQTAEIDAEEQSRKLAFRIAKDLGW